MQHPMRDIPITIFQRIEGNGPNFIAKFESSKDYPIFFNGDTAEDARMIARQFADDAVAKNEANYLSRLVALEKSRATREKNKKEKP